MHVSAWDACIPRQIQVSNYLTSEATLEREAFQSLPAGSQKELSGQEAGTRSVSESALTTREVTIHEKENSIKRKN